MNSQTTSNPSTPRFDAFLTAVENRRDNWQRLHGLAQACAAVPAQHKDSGRVDLVAETKQLLAQLDTLENYFAYPGPALMQRLRERLRSGDAIAFGELARRVAKSVLGGLSGTTAAPGTPPPKKPRRLSLAHRSTRGRALRTGCTSKCSSSEAVRPRIRSAYAARYGSFDVSRTRLTTSWSSRRHSRTRRSPHCSMPIFKPSSSTRASRSSRS